jgi:hypothetical protein
MLVVVLPHSCPVAATKILLVTVCSLFSQGSCWKSRQYAVWTHYRTGVLFFQKVKGKYPVLFFYQMSWKKPGFFPGALSIQVDNGCFASLYCPENNVLYGYENNTHFFA